MSTIHRTTIEGPDLAGHYGWSCTCRGPDGDASGYELPSSARIAAEAHGPLAADSPRPDDPPSNWDDLGAPLAEPTCGYVEDLPDGPCDNDAAPGSLYCETHRDRVQREQTVSDDMDRLNGGHDDD